MDEDLGEFTRSEDELWYQINVVVPIPAELGGYGLVRTEFAVKLGEVVTDRWDWVGGRCFRRTWVRLRDALSPP